MPKHIALLQAFGLKYKPMDQNRIEEIKNMKSSSKCNKKRFITRVLAKSALKIIQRTSKNEKIPQNFYWCEECSAFHLTSIPKQEWKGIISNK